jgi:hypothetical protein
MELGMDNVSLQEDIPLPYIFFFQFYNVNTTTVAVIRTFEVGIKLAPLNGGP